MTTRDDIVVTTYGVKAIIARTGTLGQEGTQYAVLTLNGKGRLQVSETNTDGTATARLALEAARVNRRKKFL